MFETALKNYVGSDYCIALNSGTSALHATLLAYGISENDEVLEEEYLTEEASSEESNDENSESNVAETEQSDLEETTQEEKTEDKAEELKD